MRVLCLSGAGLSAESGVPTFWGPGGLYEGFPAEEVLSAEGYRRAPDRVERWVAERRAHLDTVAPNAAHEALAGLQRRYPTACQLLTQNVDDLLERAGARDVVHLHGTLRAVRCVGRAHHVPIGPATPVPARCPTCASRLRPDVVLFGERAPRYADLVRAVRQLRADDVLLVVGTRGAVVPIEDLARRCPAHRILTMLDPSPHLGAWAFDEVHYGPATQVVPSLVATLEARLRLRLPMR